MGRGRPKKRRRAPAEESEDEDDALLFPVGAEVEVRSDDPGFLGSFYEATIAGHLSSGGYEVLYSRLEGDGGSPLRESAAASDVRPRPPPVEDRGAAWSGFVMHEMVEAFHNEGWWSGVVSAVLPPPSVTGDCCRRAYKVAFPTSRELLEFEETALRPHRVFEAGQWVPAVEADNGSPLFREGSQVEVSRSAKSFGESWNPATVLKMIGVTNFLVQYRYIGEDGELVTEILDYQYIRPSRTNTRMDSKYRFSPSSHVEVFHEGSWWPGVFLEALDSGLTKKYVVKLKSHETDMDDVESADVLTVENMHLRPRYDWDGRKWVRCLTERAAYEPQLISRKRPISAALASCDDRDEIREKPGSYLDKKLKNADVVSGPISPLLSIYNDNFKTKHKSSSCPQETVKQGNVVFALESQSALPLQPSLTEFGQLNDSSLAQYSHLEPSSSQMPSVWQSAQLQSSLFGAFGQRRPLPQAPIFGRQSLSPDLSLVEGSKKALADQAKQSTDEGCYLIASAEQKNTNVGIWTDLSRKRNECVSFQTPEGLRENPEIPKKGTDAKTIEEASNTVAISKDSTKLNHDDDVELPNDETPGCGIHSEINTVNCINLTTQKDNKGSQGRSEIDVLQQRDHVGALGDGATKVSALVESSVLSITSTLANPSDANVLSSDSSTQYGSEAIKSDKFAVNVDQDTGEEFCQRILVMDDNATVDLLPSAKICEATGHDDQLFKDNTSSMVECVMSCVIPTENLCIMSPAMLDEVMPNLLPSSENFEVRKKDDMDRANHQGNVLRLARNRHEAHIAGVDDPLSVIYLASLKGDVVIMESSTKKFAANEQHAVSQQDHGSATVECAAESSQCIEKSAITRLSSVDMSNSAEELNASLTIPKDVEGTPTSKYVESRTRDPGSPLLWRSVVVHESIMDDRVSESLATDNLPFVKTSPMWAQIEAMEIFSKVPQRPNVNQFQQHVPELREGMALGLMFSFANLAESINRLNVHDENALFKEKMEGLSLLEANGFDVRDLRLRLEALLHKKNCITELQDAMKKLEEKIADKEIDDRQLGAQIGMLTMAVRQLELHSYLLRNIMLSAISQKMNNAMEISKLKTEASEFERSYLSSVK